MENQTDNELVKLSDWLGHVKGTAQLLASGSGRVFVKGLRNMKDLRMLVALLRVLKVPPPNDGAAYDVYIDPVDEMHMFGDDQFQRLNQSIPDYFEDRKHVLAHVLGVAVRRYTETPGVLIGMRELRALALFFLN